MIKHLYANGDSCVFGQGLDPNTHIYDFTAVKRVEGWNGLLAVKMGLDPYTQYTNNALPGGSNDRIMRTTVEDVLALLTRFDASEIFVSISFTDSSRVEMFTNEHKKFIPFLLNCPPPLQSPKSIHRMNELWSTYFTHLTEQSVRFTQQILLLQKFLESLGVKYIITQSLAIFPDIGQDLISVLSTFPDRAEIVKRINWDKILHSSHFFGFSDANNVKFTDCYHPDSAGHALWADHVYNFIKERYELPL